VEPTERSLHMIINKITKNGSSWVINVPQKYLRPLGYHIGQYVQITVLSDHSLLLKPIKEEIYNVERVR